MIKFFRNVRQNLLSEGKPGKYLKYAIGEIFLVVIGILIALQINNWNQKRKIRIVEKEYLRSIAQDIQSDMVAINRIEERIEKRSEIPLRSALESMTTGRIQKPDTTLYSQTYLLPIFIKNDTIRFINEVLQINRNQYFQPNRVTLDDMISSGNLNVIGNTNLRNKLRQYYKQIDVKNLYSIDKARGETYYAKTRDLQLSFFEIDFLQKLQLEMPPTYGTGLELTLATILKDDQLPELLFNRLMWNEFELSQNQSIMEIANEIQKLINEELQQ